MKTKLFTLMALLPMIAFAQYNNGGLSTGATSNNGTAAPAGYTWSEAQNNTGNTTESNTTAGIGCQKVGTTTGNFCADDFTIPAGQIWSISSIELFGYQTGYTATTSPFTGVTLNIFSSNPSIAGAVSVFGDDTTNRFSSSTDGKMYRLFNSSVPAPGSAVGTTRKIWKVIGTASKTLAAGTYWLKFQLDAGATGNFAPPVTLPGTRGLATFNAVQYQSATSTWAPLIDAGNPATAPDYTLDMPFIINYTILGTNETLQYDNRVVLHPNPAKDYFKLTLPAESRKTSTVVSVYDVAGKLIQSFNYSESYDIRKLSPGIYLLKINDGQNVKTAKLIKN